MSFKKFISQYKVFRIIPEYCNRIIGDFWSGLQQNKSKKNYTGPQISEAEIRTALYEIAYANLKPVSETLCILYAMIALANSAFLPVNYALRLALLAGGGAAIIFFIRVVLEFVRFSDRRAHLIAAFICGVAIIISFGHIILLKAPEQATNLFLLVIGSGFIFLSPIWFSFIILVIGLAWMWCLLNFPPSPEWLHFSLALVFSVMLAVVINTIWVTTLRRLEIFRIIDEIIKKDLKKALMASDDAKKIAELARVELEVAMKAVQQSEERFRLFSDLTLEGIVIHDRGQIIDANQAFARLFGYPLPEILKARLMDLVVPEDRDMVEVNFYSEGEDIFETSGIKKDGSLVPLAIIERSIPFKNRQAKVAAFRDVTIQRQNEKIIREHAKEMEILNQIIIAGNVAENLPSFLENVLYSIITLMDFSGGGIYLVDENNEQAELIYASGPQTEFFTSIGRIKVDEGLFHQLLTSGEPIFSENYSVINPGPSGQFGVAALTCIPLFSKNKVIGFFSLVSKTKRLFNFKEISALLAIGKELGTAIAKMKTEAALKSSEEKYRELVENAGSLILRLNPRGEITFFNEFAQRFFSVSDSEIFGRNIIGTIIPPSDHQGRDRSGLVASIIKNPADFAYYESEIVGSGPKPVWIAWTNKPIYDKNGQVAEIMSIGTDISERKELEKSKDEFVSTVSHELRTPLAIIREGISLIRDKIVGVVSTQQDQLLGTSMDNIDRLSRIIDSLLDVSKIEAGKLKVSQELLNLNQLVQKVVLNFQAKAAAKNLDLRTKFSGDNIKVFADPDKTFQVISNLLDNAIKFTGSGYVEVAVKEDGTLVECAVADTGVGIAKNNLTRLFSKFEQFGRAPGAGAKGTGLGLSIAKGIVEMQGGKIWATSDINKGTCFTFTLPKKKEGEVVA